MIWVLANDHNFNLKKEIDNIDDALCGFMWELGNRILNFGEMIAWKWMLLEGAQAFICYPILRDISLY